MAEAPPERPEEYKYVQFFPIFCTAQIPTEILDNLLQQTSGSENFPDNRPVILTSTDVKTFVEPSRSPVVSFDSPFLEWIIDQVYEFFHAIVSPSSGGRLGPWPNHTFIVCDERTIEDQTCWLCTDAPDYLEGEKVICKTIRCAFDMLIEEGSMYETLLRAPSDTGMGIALRAGVTLTKELEERSDKQGYTVLSLAYPCTSAAERRETISFDVKNECADRHLARWRKDHGVDSAGSD
ncbi:hypothetical protein MMC25_003570 [Agyrium rufum]|nr:hypothetical protein [Agyrium rufum]